MKIAHLYPFTGRDKGGIAACLPPLLGALQRQGLAPELWTQSWPGEAAPGEAAPGEAVCGEAAPGALMREPSAFAVTRALTVDRSGFGYSRVLKELLGARIGEFDLVHSHGLWMWSDYLAFQSARAAGKPHLISPHGMLEPWALANSARKKKLMRALFQNRALQSARVLHALCEAEARAMRELGLQNPIAVVPNGVGLADFAALPAPAEFDERFPGARNRRVLLFMARLHPKKGLLPLIEAWRELAARFPDWLLVLAGPDEGGHRAQLEAAVEKCALQNAVLFTGMLEGKLKLAALSRADAFVLPSFSEGFSIAILEAMACGLPVILTPECHFPDALAQNAALQSAPNAAALQEPLRAILEMSDRARSEMGARGAALVARKYTWERVAADFEQLYFWCLHQGETPPFVAEN